MKFLSLTCLFLFLGLAAQAQSTGNGDPEAARDKSNVVYISNAFTPNDDGVNDNWFVTTTSTFREFNVTVMDRWGVEVFSSDDVSFKWDGRMSGRNLPIGTYVFVLSGTTTQGVAVKRSGTITLMR